jgi:hypothetical protein
VEQLNRPLHSRSDGSDGAETLELEAVDRRGRKFTCEVRILPAGEGASPDGGPSSILLMQRAATGD